MSKVIKIKESDITRIIKSIMSENEEDFEDTPNNEKSNGTKAKVIFAVNPKTDEVYVVKDPDSDNPIIVNTGSKLK